MTRTATASGTRGGALPILAFLTVAFLIVASFASPSLGTSAPEDGSLTGATLDAAVGTLADALAGARHESRHWEPSDLPSGERMQAGGRTALVLLALLESGRSLQEPGAAAAVAWLSRTEHDGTYALALRVMLWARLSDRFRPLLERDTARLLASFHPAIDGWDYRPMKAPTRRDNSTTQFAALALADAADRGVAVPTEVWARLARRFLAMQCPDGGWDYAGDGRPRGSMTAAGVATLLLAERLGDERELARAGAGPEELATSIDRGLDWLDQRFTASRHPGRSGHRAYWLFALERAGLASGRLRFADAHWLRAGAAALIDRLLEPTDDGFRLARPLTVSSLPECALALLFLQRGLRPCAFALVEETAASSETSAAARIMAGAIGDSIEDRVRWHRVSSEDRSSDWLEPPAILLVANERTGPRRTGATPIPVATAGRIAAAVATGTTLLALIPSGADGVSVRDAIRDALGLGDWRRIARDDRDARMLDVGPGSRPTHVLSAGVRPLAIAVESPPLRSGSNQRARERARNVNAQTLAPLVAAWLLACDRDPTAWRLRRPSDAFPAADRIGVLTGRDASTPRDDLHDAVLHLGVSDHPPEPNAIVALLEHGVARDGLQGARVLVGALAALPEGARPAAIVLSGTTPPSDEAALDRLAALVRAGVPILVESTGGRGSFARAVGDALVARGLAPATPIHTHPMFAGGGGTAPIRRTAAAVARDGVRASHGLRGISGGNGETASVILSDDDLTHALLGRPHARVHGWATPDARAAVGRFVRWAISGAPRAGPPSANADRATDPDDTR